MRIAGIIAAGVLAAVGVGAGSVAHAADPPWGSDVTEPVGLLGDLHRAATHEVQLGDLAASQATTPEVRRYGTDLANDFRGVDQRIIALAAGLGVPDTRLQVSRNENVVALKKDTDDFGRLAGERGEGFDRDYWVTVADAQARESDLLAATAAREPALTDLVTDMSRLYDRSSRRALAAATAEKPKPTETAPADLPSDTPADTDAAPDQPAP